MVWYMVGRSRSTPSPPADKNGKQKTPATNSDTKKKNIDLEVCKKSFSAEKDYLTNCLPKFSSLKPVSSISSVASLASSSGISEKVEKTSTDAKSPVLVRKNRLSNTPQSQKKDSDESSPVKDADQKWIPGLPPW